MIKRTFLALALLASTFASQASVSIIGSKAVETLKSIDYKPLLEAAQSKSEEFGKLALAGLDVAGKELAAFSQSASEFLNAPVALNHGEVICIATIAAVMVWSIIDEINSQKNLYKELYYRNCPLFYGHQSKHRAYSESPANF